MTGLDDSGSVHEPAGPAPVSVVVPCYRCAATVRRAVESAAAQTLPPRELILVDDASGDGTLDALRAIQRDYGPEWVRIVVLEANVGAASARNAGWAAARARYVAFLDADDAWHPRKVELQVGFMDANPDVALCGHAHQQVRASIEHHSTIDAVRGTDVPYRELLLSNRFITPSVMLRRELPHRFAAGKRHMEDFLLWLTIAAHGHRVVRLDAPLAYVFKAPFGQTGLSADLVAMERAELDVYRTLRREGHLGTLPSLALKGYSVLKFSRRIVLARLLGYQGSLPWLFPIVYLTVTHSMTALLIMVGLFGDPGLAADIALVHGATVATFHALSANTRNLILTPVRAVSIGDILRTRLMLVGPLAAGAYLLALSGAGIAPWLALCLVLRRCVEWFNEIQLCEAEYERRTSFSAGFLMLQSVLFGAAALALVMQWPYAPFVLAVWALAPLAVTAPLARFSRGDRAQRFPHVLRKLLGHAGSTAISGVALYAFRLIVVLLLARELAGELFTAIAIGSFIGTLFANVVGPSIELHEQRTGRRLPRPVRLILALNLGLGTALTAAAIAMPATFLFFGKMQFFWLACGLSLIGGVVMVWAQQARLRVLRSGDGRDVFGPDVLIHVGLLGASPLLVGVFGPTAATSLYLVNAALAYVFYRSSELASSAGSWRGGAFSTERIRFVAALLLVFPLFFQLSGQIYDSPEPGIDSGGVLATLPLPVSLLACFAGIVMLADYRRATRSFVFVFVFFAAMLLSAVITTADNLAAERGKLLLLIQFLLPAFGLVLGEMFEPSRPDDRQALERGFFWACAAIMPAQLAASWLQGEIGLTHHLWLFSIYQHWQYVPVVLACAALVASPALDGTPRYRPWTLPLLVVAVLYALSAFSMLATFISGLGLVVFGIRRLPRLRYRTAFIAVGGSAIAIAGLLLVLQRAPEFRLKFVSSAETEETNHIACASEPAVFVSALVSSSADECVATGKPTPRFGYLIALRPLRALPGDTFFVEGVVRHGGVTVGLVSGNKWATREDVLRAGPFSVELRPRPGLYQGIVANNPHDSAFNDVTIRRVEWRRPNDNTGDRSLESMDMSAQSSVERAQEALPAAVLGALPNNLVERIGDWILFGGPVFDSPEAFAFGHARPMDRLVRTSAHNYYLDLAYNFGVLALLPLAALFAYTLRLLWRRRFGVLKTEVLLWLSGVVLFMIVLDSNFKVTLRQPYPGLFAFFLWGVLIARLRGTAYVIGPVGKPGATP